MRAQARARKIIGRGIRKRMYVWDHGRMKGIRSFTPLRFCSVFIMLSLMLTGCQSLHIGGQRPNPAEDLKTIPSAAELRVFKLNKNTEVIGEIRTTQVRPEETLLDIARRYDLGYDEIIAANPGVDPWLPQPGSKIVIPTQFILPMAPRRGLVINLAARRLFFYLQSQTGEAAQVITHPLGIGREGWYTPLVQTKIVSKQVNPSWRVPPSIRAEHAQDGEILPAVVPPGPDNPLGTRALRLGVPGYLIHGTNKPAGVGMRVSHGCLQLYPEDIETLFEQVPVNTPVVIVNQPYLVGRKEGVVFLEAHGDARLDGRGLEKAQQQVRQLLTKLDKGGQPKDIDMQRLRMVLDALGGYPQIITVKPQSGMAVDQIRSNGKTLDSDPS